MSPRSWVLAGALLAALAATAPAADWYTRVKELGVVEAAAEDVRLHEQGRIPDSLHVGDCYYHLERFAEGVDVFRRLRKAPDRNYAAAATVREGEGLVRLGRPGSARALFGACLREFPEAFLDVDLPTLCRAWLKKLEGREDPEEAGAAKEEESGESGAREGEETGLRAEIESLEGEIAELKARLAALRKKLEKED